MPFVCNVRPGFGFGGGAAAPGNSSITGNMFGYLLGQRVRSARRLPCYDTVFSAPPGPNPAPRDPQVFRTGSHGYRGNALRGGSPVSRSVRFPANPPTRRQIASAINIHQLRLPLHLVPAERCPHKLRGLVWSCWEPDPARRPAAAEIVKALALVQEVGGCGSLSSMDRGRFSLLPAMWGCVCPEDDLQGEVKKQTSTHDKSGGKLSSQTARPGMVGFLSAAMGRNFLHARGAGGGPSSTRRREQFTHPESEFRSQRSVGYPGISGRALDRSAVGPLRAMCLDPTERQQERHR